jgi:hypothetical protein
MPRTLVIPRTSRAYETLLVDFGILPQPERVSSENCIMAQVLQIASVAAKIGYKFGLLADNGPINSMPMAPIFNNQLY